MANNSERALDQRMDFYGLHDISGQFPRIQKALRKSADSALDHFYDTVSATTETSGFFPDRAAMNKAHQAQRQHWHEIFEDGLTPAYFERATRIGNVHARIGLDPQWYIGGYAMIMEQVIEKMITGGVPLPHRKRTARAVSTLVKVAMLDMDIALSTYFARAEENVRSIVVDKIGTAIDAISRGNLTARIEGMPEAYSKLEDDFNSAIDRLRTTIQTVTKGAESINAGSSEIRSASDDLAMRTEKQAASLEESSAAMSQLTQMVGETAKAVADLTASVVQTHKEATHGGQVVNDAVAAMSDIQKSAHAIAQIITIIDGIAFQTNLLALNAGVEAARVGDLGKGFAVVASEVRALAQRSSEAAEEIKGLVKESLEQVDKGVTLVNNAGKALQTIVDQVSGITTVATEISASTEQQSANLREVNSAVSDMDRMTQQNAAMVEESTAAARAMAGEAERLSDTVSQFTLDQGSSPAARPKAVSSTKAVSSPKSRPAPIARKAAGNLAVMPVSDGWEEF